MLDTPPESVLDAELESQSSISLEKVASAIQSTRDYLLRCQHAEGYWVGRLEADASATAGYVPLMYFLFGWVDPKRQKKTVEYVRSKQNPDGSWPTHYGGPGDLDVSIQCYLALKLCGQPADEPYMRRARDFILSQGGLTRANAFTKIFLAVFGQYDYRGVPSAPPEIIFLPKNFYFNIYEFASWSRETLMALTIVLTQKPVCKLPESAHIDELFIEPESERHFTAGRIGNPFSWRGFFLIADRLFKLWDRLSVKPGRAKALRKVEAWVVEHQEADGSWGGIGLPWIYSLIALKSLGYPLEHPVMALGIDGFEDFLIEDEHTICLQPATSPVWDTAWVVVALREAGLDNTQAALIKAAKWLLSKEIRMAGDWQVLNPGIEPGGWSFEFVNDWYPDLDDTALVPRALLRVGLKGEAVVARSQAIRRAIDWTLGMQSSNGGWGAFDKDNNKQALAHVPFADFMSPLDPTCADVTAHALEFLAEVSQGDEAKRRGIQYLKRTQEKDGAWYGRWGVNYIYGTGLALASLAAVGEQMDQPFVRKAVDWLVSRQNPDGGWGETCMTYIDPSLRGQGPSTASQTAWALTGLLAAGESLHPATEKAVEYLLDTQQPEGDWEEPYFTGTGFPRVFYLRYDLYRVYFPLIALAHYYRAVDDHDQ